MVILRGQRSGSYRTAFFRVYSVHTSRRELGLGDADILRKPDCASSVPRRKVLHPVDSYTFFCRRRDPKTLMVAPIGRLQRLSGLSPADRHRHAGGARARQRPTFAMRGAPDRHAWRRLASIGVGEIVVSPGARMRALLLRSMNRSADRLGRGIRALTARGRARRDSRAAHVRARASRRRWTSLPILGQTCEALGAGAAEPAPARAPLSHRRIQLGRRSPRRDGPRGKSSLPSM